MIHTARHYLSIRIFTKLACMIAGFTVLLVALVWTRATLAWGTSALILQWTWFVIALVAGISSIAASLKTVSSRSLHILILVDIILASVIWWL